MEPAQLDVMRRTAIAARDYCRLIGLDAAHVRGLTITTVRQVIQESGAGTSQNARRNNFFGQKSRIRDGAEINVDRWATGEYLLTSNPEWRDGVQAVDPDWMYTYASLEDSVRAHVDYVTGRSGMARYLDPPADPDAIASWLVTPPRAYATDPTYAASLRGLDARWGVTALVDPLLQEPAMPLPHATRLGHTADLLTQWGYKVTRVAGWESRQASTIPLVPVAIIQHHTAARETPLSYLLDGDSQRHLPGPLSQWQVKRSGEIILLAAGYANHAGYVDPAAFDVIASGHAPLDAEVIPGPDSTTWSANRHSIGIEADGPGGPDDWSAEETAACIALNAALNITYGWTAAVRTGAHKEITRRKPADPVVHMGRFRRDILAEIGRRTGSPAEASPLSSTSETIRKGSTGAAVLRWTTWLHSMFSYAAKVSPGTYFGEDTEAATREFQRRVNLDADGIVGPKTYAAARKLGFKG